MSVYSYTGDPRWINARFNSMGACGHNIRRGDRVFYYPKGKIAFCVECSDQRAREFEAAAADEDAYNQGYQ